MEAERAFSILDTNIPIGTDFKHMWKYSGTGKYRAKPAWHELLPQRGIISDIFDETGGT